MAPTVSAASILQELRTFDLELKAEEDEIVLERMVELCLMYKLKEDDIACEWIAFSTTKRLPLTVDNLNLLEHESSQKRNLSTPENPRSKRVLSASRSPHLLFSPSSFSPSATPSQKYGSRSNRGEVVISFNMVQGISWSGHGGKNTNVKLFISTDELLTKTYRFMFQKLLDVREVLNSKIEDLGCVLKEHFHIEEFSSVSLPAQEPITVLGQIGCDSNGKLNAKSVILEGDQEHSSGMQVPVDVSEMKEYSLFPGQVVVMEGINSTGRKLIVSRLYEGVPLPFYEPTEMLEDSVPQMVLVACGPYTTSDSITYEPMRDLIDVINRDRPDICILLGPFLDAKHEQVENCQLTASFENVFEHCLKMIIEGTRSAASQLVFVPSMRDVNQECVYPQPPFSCYEPSKDDKPRVHFVSDPCTLNINSIVFGVTTTDLLFHMGAEEISSFSGASDRFSRLLKHILTQRSYYPLYPPNEEMNIDYESLYNYAQMSIMPDIFIVPSELRYFIKDVLGCVCINPGRLTKGQVGGTYGRLLIKREAVAKEKRKSPCVSAQVVRI
ncbi:DNA polymerase alpha subunit B isoform X2 [Rhinatrema bivittatum]|uniref:DNA polymerase alpha subunit B isoform X2 n=1 Tax=Rhinatrema bivittatum TaxID=194408 RepID=UPI00112B81A8|nr:DNA polymerase alpha subunit B isoform X2 [Rhinatrema bivittatum]